jgi:phytoene dehydrogenase-like protein
MQRTALVAGSGPNGLAAAIRLAQAGVDVTVREAAMVAGGATRSDELTLPGFTHDLGSAVHPMAVSSPFFSTLNLQQHGLEWIWPKAELAHPFDDGTAVLIERDITRTAAQFGSDAQPYRAMFEPLSENWPTLVKELLKPLGLTMHPLLMAKFGMKAVQPAARLTRTHFSTERARTVFAGLAAHSTLPLEEPISSAFGLVLGAIAHAVGWPVPKGGSQRIASALESVLRTLGGRVVTNDRVTSLSAKSGNDVTLCDFTPRQFLELSSSRLPKEFRRRMEGFRYGPGVYKVDWALREPIPWKAKECLRAATVHLGGTYAEICESEAAVNHGRLTAKPFVLLAQPSLFDNTRAPAGYHTAWAYCHVPNGFRGSALEQIQGQIERFAPGFRDCVLARSELSVTDMQKWNENLIGGDINGGAVDWRQFFFRPTRMQYRTPIPGVFFCSSSTPPGGSVHGMCGYWAAQAALRYLKIGR